MNSKKLILIINVMVATAFIGCSSNDRPEIDRSVVKGTVTLDGNPVKDGSITFTSPEDVANGVTSSGTIKDGQYEAKVTLGEKSVKINAIEVTGTAEVEGWEDTEEIIPEKYNSKTTLKASVGSEEQELNFDLKSR